jgi:hypothetical protein
VWLPSSPVHQETTHPYGTSPALDALWSTEQVELAHDGFEATRLEKIRALTEVPAAMRWLRVCQAGGSDYNCGRCEKCLRTMVELHILGALDRCRTLPGELDPQVVSRAGLSPISRPYWEESLRHLEQSGDASLAQAVRAALGRRRGPRLRRRLRRELRRRRLR